MARLYQQDLQEMERLTILTASFSFQKRAERGMILSPNCCDTEFTPRPAFIVSSISRLPFHDRGLANPHENRKNRSTDMFI